ncbi:MAG: dockerin type I domain-containing protein, partial [Coriobacteriales bacterium]|nr:dockerin type I domain-containing protein [Coriobacteriales bacterium]
IPIDFTIDHWTPLDDTNLNLFATKGTHALKVNDEDFTATFDAETESFIVTPGAPAPPSVGPPQSGDLDGDGHPTAGEALQVARAVISGSASWSPEKIAAADMDGDGYLTMADVVRILRKAAGLS